MASPKEGATKTQNGQKYVYKNGQWRQARFRTPANDLIEGTGNTARNTTQRTAAATSTAASRTAERERQAQQQAIGLRGRNQKPAAKPAATTQSLTQRDKRIGNTDVTKLRQQQDEAVKAYKQSRPAPTNPSPAPSASRPSTPAPTRSSGSPSSTSKPSPKPVPKPAGKVPASSETYRDGGKGLYQGSKEYRDKVGGSGNPLLNRFRQDMGRDADSGSKAEPKMSKPEDKSNYVASNGKPYMGPAFGSGKAEPAKPASPASPNKSEKGMTLAERMRRRRQSGMA